MSYPFNVRIARIALLRAFVALGLLLAGAAHADAVPSEARPVGEVTMSVGPVVRTSAQGLPETVRRGSMILPGDRLDTAEGGHLHIRFIDGAMVSVRPGSRLWVQDYRYEPQQPAMSLVRFKLEYGVARAISGAAAENAKDRFRLNTPLVAIGVRGTDFVVRSGDSGTTAAVNQGAIIMAPFGEGCHAQSLGPCGSSTARLLSADMGQLLVEFRSQFSQPEIKALNGAVFAANAADGSNGHTLTTLARANGPLSPATTGLGRSDSDALATTALNEGAVQAVIDGHTAPPDVSPPPVDTPTPPTPVPPVQDTASALKWGRWSVAGGEGDIAVSRDEAAKGRSVTVGNSQYSLYREGSSTANLVPGLGAYQFNLDHAFAQYNLSGQVTPASVDQGRLSIDFGARKFSTDLRVTNALTGTVAIAGAGFVRSDGIFTDRSVAGQAIAGAAALDGKSAGYLFDKAVGAGTLSGITLWSRP